MKITSRERNLWLLVLVGVGLMIGYNWLSQRGDQAGSKVDNHTTLAEARRLLRSEKNIIARNEATVHRLTELERYFLSAMDQEQVVIDFLGIVEKMAFESKLQVERKSVIDLKNGLLGIALEGTTSAESFFSFMHQTATASTALNLQRVQINSRSDNKTLNYQVIVMLKLI